MSTHTTLAAAVLLLTSSAGCGIGDPEDPLEPGEGGHEEHGADGGTGGTSGELVVEAGSTDTWVHWSLDDGDVLMVDDPSSSTDWDLRIRRTQLATNGGTSGSGQGGALALDASDWDAVTACPADGYTQDEMLPLPGPPGSGEFSGNPVLNDWYDYDPATHAVSTKGLVYCLRAADGETATKLSVMNYASGNMTLRWEVVPLGE